MVVALDETGADPAGFFQDLDPVEALEDLLPDHAKLHLGQAIADTAVDAETEAEVLARPFAVDDEPLRLGNGGLVAIARDVPHDHLVALPDGLAAELDVFQRRAAHVGERGLPADDLRH